MQKKRIKIGLLCFVFFITCSIMPMTAKAMEQEAEPLVIVTGKEKPTEKNKITGKVIGSDDESGNMVLLLRDMKKGMLIVSGDCNHKLGIVVRPADDSSSHASNGANLYAGKNQTAYLRVDKPGDFKLVLSTFDKKAVDFSINLFFVQDKDMSLKNGKTEYAALTFADENDKTGRGNESYYKVTVPKDGKIKLEIDYYTTDLSGGHEFQQDFGRIILCKKMGNSYKEFFSDKDSISLLENGKAEFYVKKGTYYLKHYGTRGVYKIKATVKAVSDKSGTTKKTAKKIKLGKKVSNVFFYGASNKENWYKFTADSKKTIHITLKNSRNSSFDFQILDSKGKLYYRSSISKQQKEAKQTTIQKGAYFVKVSIEDNYKPLFDGRNTLYSFQIK